MRFVFLFDQVERWIEDRRRHLREQEKVDAEVARRVAMEMSDAEIARRMAVESSDVEIVRRMTADANESHRRFEAERLQRPAASAHLHQRQHSSHQQQQNHHHHHSQQQHQQMHHHSHHHQQQHPNAQRHPLVPQPRGVVNHHFSSPSPSTTPPLPVMSNGDVPTASHPPKNDFASHQMKNDLDDVLPHVRGGLRYNDEQYLVKLARLETTE